MHRYLDRLEKNIGNTKAGKILFNKYYNLKDFHWTILYTTAFGILAGLGNAFPEIQAGFAKSLYAFSQGFLNNTYLSIFINLFYARIVNFLSNKKHFRINANILWAITQPLFLLWHMFIGTENPIATFIPLAILAFILTNYQVSAVKNR